MSTIIFRIIAVISFLSSISQATIPLPSAPDWTSSDNDYATGGSFADVNGDFFVDLCTSNGNDMNMDLNSVYINSNGTLETVASWRSNDNGLFGHCYSGDLNNDGLPDLAVAYLGSGGSGDLRVRVYYNNGTGLNPTPGWKARDQHSSFDCCLGDFDLDGDLDVAISAGDAYQGEIDSARIYRNNAGVLDTLPCWTAHEGTASDAIRFCDIDKDGDLDLFVGQRRRISMYRNNGGVLETTPSWVARTDVGWVLRLALDDYDQDGWPDLAAACNDQLGDPNGVRVYHNSSGTLDTLPSFRMLRNGDYTSCVEWADFNGDGYPDLAAGGWWAAVCVFENRAGILDTIPTWQWRPGTIQDLVCEALVSADLANAHLEGIVDALDGDGQRRLFTLRNRPVQFLDSVTVEGTRVPASGFCFDPLIGWVSFAAPPPSGTGNVVCFYRCSTHPDLAVTNWDPPHGNHLFRNTTPVGAAAQREGALVPRISARPNPFSSVVSLQLPASSLPEVRIVDATGRLVRSFPPSSLLRPPSSLTWDGRDDAGRILPSGTYLAIAGLSRLKLVRTAGN